MSNKVLSMIGSFLSMLGVIGLLVFAGWKVALSVFILVAGNNMEQWARKQ